MSELHTGQATRQAIRDFILDQFPLARQRQLRDDDSLLHDGLIDSLGTLDVVAFLESHFAISLSDEDLVSENFGTIEILTTFVESKLSADPAPWRATDEAQG